MPVYHLKHRPRLVSQLDLTQVRKKLSLILAEKEKPSAFLFAGPKGSGKTSAARVLARAVNCLKPAGVNPCNKCKNCREILSGASIDLIEIDGASNRGIDDVRTLREGAYLAPAKLKIKVFIIDEVHMLTKEAFNALLKLLEEPPKNVLVVMCTTEPGKIPETVLSRLTRVDFAKGSKEELRRSLARVIKGEELKVAPKAVDLLVNKSDGSFRNLHMSLAQLVTEAGKKISFKQAEVFLAGRGGDYEGKELEADLAAGKLGEILGRLEKLALIGVDFGVLRINWLYFFQQRMLVDRQAGTGEGRLGLRGIRRLLELLIEAGAREKEAEIGQLPLQLAMVEFLDGARQNGLAGQDGGRIGFVGRGPTIGGAGRRAIDLSVQEIETKWEELLAAVKPFNHSVEAFMRSSRPGRVEGQVLTLEVFYPFHKDRLEEEKNRKLVEQGLRQVFGCDLALKCVLSDQKRKPLGLVNRTTGAGPGLMAEAGEAGESGEDKDLYDAAKEIFR